MYHEKINSTIVGGMFCICCLILCERTIHQHARISSGTTIEVTSGADICADRVIINGTYTGSGTKCGGTLPVELTTFTATLHLSIVDLQWKTAMEVNNAEFEIERQPASLSHWTQIASVPGAGTTNAPHTYSYNDNIGPAGTYCYRLKQIDRDGAFKYSQEVQVTIEVPRVFALIQNYPDPFNPTTTIQFTVPSNGRAVLKVFDALGKEVVTLFNDQAEAGSYHQVQFNASSLASGTYYARLDFNGNVQLKKMLLLK
ncbi:MAG: T9SS type A sorting domain-containing protein [Bacteroidota bacterium]